jgi:hypothetical protein
MILICISCILLHVINFKLLMCHQRNTLLFILLPYVTTCFDLFGSSSGVTQLSSCSIYTCLFYSFLVKLMKLSMVKLTVLKL